MFDPIKLYSYVDAITNRSVACRDCIPSSASALIRPCSYLGIQHTLSSARICRAHCVEILDAIEHTGYPFRLDVADLTLADLRGWLQQLMILAQRHCPIAYCQYCKADYYASVPGEFRQDPRMAIPCTGLVHEWFPIFAGEDMTLFPGTVVVNDAPILTYGVSEVSFRSPTVSVLSASDLGKPIRYTLNGESATGIIADVGPDFVYVRGDRGRIHCVSFQNTSQLVEGGDERG